MKKAKITIVGAGNVGATAAWIAAERGLGDIVLLDIVQGLAEGKALDMAQAKAVFPAAGNIIGTRDWAAAAGSDLFIVTSGLARKPGMSRDDLLAKNTEIIHSVCQHIAAKSPNAFVIVVSNPLDAMTYAAAKVTGFDKRKVIGMAGVLDAARFNCFIAEALNVWPGDVQSILLGGHGDDMVPLARFTTVAGVPLAKLMPADKINQLIDRTRNGGIEIVNLLGTSAYYAPAAGAVKMAQAILFDRRELMCCCAYCDGQYGLRQYVGVPVILSANGVEQIIELELTDQEKQLFAASAQHVRELTAKVDTLLTQ